MTEQRSNPYDAYFRKVMSRPINAASELRADLRNRFNDLLFCTRLDGRRAYVYLLIEHQSSSDRLMAFRMLEYMVAIWRQHLIDNEKAKTLP